LIEPSTSSADPSDWYPFHNFRTRKGSMFASDLGLYLGIFLGSELTGQILIPPNNYCWSLGGRLSYLYLDTVQRSKRKIGVSRGGKIPTVVRESSLSLNNKRVRLLW
jgi:hypothetical protein